MSDEEMQAIAAEVGYSETAFVTPLTGDELDVRYFSPLAEVNFCGHATIAASVALGRSGDLVLHTPVGDVPVRASAGGTATLTSVEPRVSDLAADDLEELLSALRLSPDDLDPALPARVAYAGVYHPVIALRSRESLRALDYDFDRLGRLMAAREWTTIQVVWRERPDLFHARDPFPPGGVVEDPATGAAAAALGGYLRSLRLVEPPARVTVTQGEDMGRLSRLDVEIPESGGIPVTGGAVEL